MSEKDQTSDSISARLTEKYSLVGHKEVEGQKVQVGIGAIKVGEDNVSIETLPGCSITGLLDIMQRVTREIGKPTMAEHGDLQILVELKKQEE